MEDIFLKLTGKEDKDIFIDPTKINYVEVNDNLTYISFGKYGVLVKETPNEVGQLIKDDFNKHMEAQMELEEGMAY